MNPDFTDDSTDTIHVEYQYKGDEPPSAALVRTIAIIEDVDLMDMPTALGISLYDHVDPEALDRLLDTTGDSAGLTIELTLHTDQQYDVLIQDTGRLVVEKEVANSTSPGTDTDDHD